MQHECRLRSLKSSLSLKRVSVAWWQSTGSKNPKVQGSIPHEHLRFLPRPTSNDMTTNHLSKQEPSITRVCYAIDLLTCSFGFRACYLSLNSFNYEHNRRRGSYRVHNKKITLACKPCSICPICLRNAALGICAICTQTVFHS